MEAPSNWKSLIEKVTKHKAKLLAKVARQTETKERDDEGDGEMRKILVALPKEIVDLVERELIGKLGEGYWDAIRTIIIS
jgi:hypothetical protein